MTQKNTRRGFTLIELLVVILIIGILAAVAVPQYQKAVDKSRFMKYIQVAHGIKRAQEIYYLANGEYTAKLTDLDVEYTGDCTDVHTQHEWKCPDGFFIDLESYSGRTTGWLRLSLCPEHNTNSSNCHSYQEAEYTLWLDYADNKNKRGQTACTGYTTRGKAICKSLQNQ